MSNVEKWTQQRIDEQNAKAAIKKLKPLGNFTREDVEASKTIHASSPIEAFTEKMPLPIPAVEQNLLNRLVAPAGYFLEFTIPIEPMGAVRMNRSDAWRKRPAVVRYWAAKDAIKAVVGEVAIPDVLECRFLFPVRASWSKKKKARMIGQPHKVRPDGDNICKLAQDALWKQDSAIWKGSFEKRWTVEGGGRIELRLMYFDKSPSGD